MSGVMLTGNPELIAEVRDYLTRTNQWHKFALGVEYEVSISDDGFYDFVIVDTKPDFIIHGEQSS